MLRFFFFKSIIFSIYKISFMNACYSYFLSNQFRFSCSPSRSLYCFPHQEYSIFLGKSVILKSTFWSKNRYLCFYLLHIAHRRKRKNVFISIVTYSPSFGGCYPKWKITSHAQHCTIWRADSYISLRSVHRTTHLLFLRFLRRTLSSVSPINPRVRGMNCSTEQCAFLFPRAARSTDKLKTAYWANFQFRTFQSDSFHQSGRLAAWEFPNSPQRTPTRMLRVVSQIAPR